MKLASRKEREGALSGVILRSTYLGSVVEYEVDVPGTEPLTVHITNPFEREPLSPGAEVSLSLLPEGIHFLPE